MIEFQNVTKIYPNQNRAALENVDMTINKGEFVFLVGPSGSGKSSFLRLILREERPNEGQILVAGNDLARLTNWKVPALRRKIGRKVTVRLLVEDRNGKKPGESGEMKPPDAAVNTIPIVIHTPTSDSEVMTIDLSFQPQVAGDFKVAVEAVPLEGEVKTQNNLRQTILVVQKGGLKVAYFDTARPEQKWLKHLGAAEKIQLDYQEIKAGEFKRGKQIDRAWFEPGKYDAYIIGDVPADTFDPEMLAALAARVDEGAGLMMIGGQHSFGPGGWASTPLADILPVEMSPNDYTPNGPPNPDTQIEGDLQMVPTERGLDNYLMRIDPGDDQNQRRRWESLRPLAGANRLRPKAGGLVEVLAQSAEGAPLLVAQEYGRARVLAFAGDTTYLWYTYGHREAHQRFWRQVILWLCRKEMDSDKRVWVRADAERRLGPARRVDLRSAGRPGKTHVRRELRRDRHRHQEDGARRLPGSRPGGEHGHVCGHEQAGRLLGSCLRGEKE